MGADANFEEAYDDEGPGYRVNVPAFAIGKYPVTQAEWVAVMGSNPSDFKGRSRPVEQVNWHDAQTFVRRLSEQTGQAYRLPTEAQWEYAARAGTDTTWYFGDDANQLRQHAWYSANSGDETRPVGQLKANAWGLHDVHGNVFEWVEDCYHGSYRGAPTNGSAWTTNCYTYDGSTPRVLRGGSWASNLRNTRSALRYWSIPDSRSILYGFRVARMLSGD